MGPMYGCGIQYRSNVCTGTQNWPHVYKDRNTTLTGMYVTDKKYNEVSTSWYTALVCSECRSVPNVDQDSVPCYQWVHLQTALCQCKTGKECFECGPVVTLVGTHDIDACVDVRECHVGR
jgi:hypothetical protein